MRVGPFWPLGGPLVQRAKPPSGARVTAAQCSFAPHPFGSSLAHSPRSLALRRLCALSLSAVTVAVGGGLGLPLDDRRYLRWLPNWFGPLPSPPPLCRGSLEVLCFRVCVHTSEGPDLAICCCIG
jgi:hypothetical protein